MVPRVRRPTSSRRGLLLDYVLSRSRNLEKKHVQVIIHHGRLDIEWAIHMQSNPRTSANVLVISKNTSILLVKLTKSVRGGHATPSTRSLLQLYSRRTCQVVNIRLWDYLRLWRTLRPETHETIERLGGNKRYPFTTFDFLRTFWENSI
jgi:hypothetical protein